MRRTRELELDRLVFLSDVITTSISRLPAPQEAPSGPVATARKLKDAHLPRPPPQNPPVPPSSLTFHLLQNPVKPIHVSLRNSNFPNHPCAHLHRDFPVCTKTHDPGVINTNPLADLRASSSKKGTDDWRPGLPSRLCHGFAVRAD